MKDPIGVWHGSGASPYALLHALVRECRDMSPGPLHQVTCIGLPNLTDEWGTLFLPPPLIVGPFNAPRLHQEEPTPRLWVNEFLKFRVPIGV